VFCPQCGTESPADLKFCRSCGANLRVIGKAVTLSEAIARSDSVPAKVKDLVKNLKIEKVTDEVARAMEKMNQELAGTAEDHREWHRHRTSKRKEKTAEQRREQYLTSGFVTMFSGIGLGGFLYFLGHNLVLNLTPDDINKIPFDLNSLLHVIWLIGLVPTLSGFGRILAGLTIRRERQEIASPMAAPLRIEEPVEPAFAPPPAVLPRHDVEATVFAARTPPDTVTDRTTNILNHQPTAHQTDEIG